MSVIPNFSISASAASVSYYETTKDKVPLRDSIGEEKPIRARVAKKGTVVKVQKEEKNWINPFYYTTWYKVKIAPGVINDTSYDQYWVYSGNVTEHEHKLKAGACTSTGCDYAKTIREENIDDKTMIVKVATAVVRTEPYNDGEKKDTLKKGDVVTATHKIKNYKDSIWYKLSSGDYIFSENVEPASEKKEAAITNNVNNNNSGGNSGSDSSGSGGGTTNTDYFKPPTIEELLCSHEKWNIGKCVNCGRNWVLKIEQVTGTYVAKDNDTVARDIPYKQGAEKVTYQKGDAIDIKGKAKNSAGNTWYLTKAGYWVYGVENATLQTAGLNFTNYSFKNINESAKLEVRTVPDKAHKTCKIEWTSSDKDGKIITVSDTGVITAKGVGKATVTCKVTAPEGTVKTLKAEIVVEKEAEYETWAYSNKKFEDKLALECSTYASLAYPHYNYYYENGKILVYSTDSKPKTPTNLTKLLSERNYNYSISNNYYNMTRTNSPYVLAHKMVKYNDKPTPLIFVIIEGSAGKTGWEGNMLITGESYDKNVDDHYTFNLAANNMKKGLEEYITKNSLSKPMVVITGHSRGSAVGNLLAYKLNKEAEKDSSRYGQIYAYLFATPNAAKTTVAYNNIFNICNESDLVPYIPCSNTKWDYEKHGQIYQFDSVTLRGKKTDKAKEFMQYAEKEFKKSRLQRTPDYNWCSKTPEELRDYVAGKWKSREQYYKKGLFKKCGDVTAYDYFLKGLASAASGGSTAVIKDHLTHINDNSCPFGVISRTLAGNAYEELAWGDLRGAFRDCHEMMTYHAAILTKNYSNATTTHLFEDTANYGNGSVKLNEAEQEILTAFFEQDENELMLEEAGWDIEDPTTWEGIKWNTEGNVVNIDLSYMNLSGWFNANSFSKLQDLNLDGNYLSMLAVSECNELANLSCMANNIRSLVVNECSQLQNLDCAFNQIGSLDLSNMSQLTELNCYGNQIEQIDLSGATALQTVRCGSNEITSLNLSTNVNLSTIYCEDNNIVESQNKELVEKLDSINLSGGAAIIGGQKYNKEYSFNETELSRLTDFANMSLNLEKLGWNLEEPYTWQGVKWEIIGDEYHVTAINFDGLDLEGDLNLPEVEYIESVSCEGSSLNTLNLSGCSSLNSVNCYNSGISSLEINDCSKLESINCDENYLEVEDVESSLSQIGLSTGIASYETQNIAADEDAFDQTEREMLITFLSTGNNAEILGWDWDWPGTWDGIIWTKVNDEYRVNKIYMGDKEVCGELDLSMFEYLEEFDFRGTQIEKIILPDSVTKIPEAAFYNSAVKYVYMSEGVTNIEESAFAYCNNLNTLVLPASVTKIKDGAFYGSSELKNLVFMGDEPLEIGTEIAYGTSPEFKIIFFRGTTWINETEVLSAYPYIKEAKDYIVLQDENIELKNLDYYSETNHYAGDDISVTVISKNPGSQANCILSVYNESNVLDNLNVVSVDMNTYMNVVTFEDVNIQYAGEESCVLRAFLWSDSNGVKPLATSTEKFLAKVISK